jgi:competence ComEA-like helix-hairpin-helix protein
MATTPLRIYLHDIEGMVGAGQMEEAIAHCRHILQTFPKSIAVYRLLGKAYLENQRYSDAADVFQRVLSAVPDDFVSHVGMSIIREDEGNLDASIWHMERAFETQPYNSAIQDELRRLYGRRDGMEPPKMRLTRGALARLYMKGDLHQQAIGELRAALAEDPQRPDLQALLARVYYMAGQRVEAVETCSTLLKRLPYCLDANILLGAILPETERAQDAQNYRQRAMSLEPYFSQAPSNVQTADNVPTNAVTVEKLVYTPGKAGTAETGQPAWATSLGVAFTEQKEGEALPEWLSTPTDTSLSLEGSEGRGVSPFSSGEAPSAFPWEPPSDETTPSEAEPVAAETIPEWMKDAGWTPSTGEAKEGPISFDLGEETEAPVEGELAPADIPDWLREAAPPGVLEQPPAQGEEKSTEEILPWLQDNPPGPTDTIVNWLSETKGEAPRPTEEVQPGLPAELFQQLEGEEATPSELGELAGAVEAEIPEWLKESAPSGIIETPGETAEASEVPAWMQTDETTAQAESEKELPDWLASTGVETPAVSADLPDWLKSETLVEGEPAGEIEQFATSEEELPDWLKAEPAAPESPALPEVPAEAIPTEIMPEEVTPVEEAPTGPVLAEILPVEAAPSETAAPAEEFPAWLKEVEAEIPDEAVETPHLKGVTEWLETVNTGDLVTGPVGITDFLKNVESGEGTSAAEPGPSAVDLFPWMREEKAEGTGETSATQEIPPAVPAEELPDWMREIEAGLPVAAAEQGGSVVEGQGAAEIDLTGTIPPSAEQVPGEVTPAFEGEMPAGVNLEDQDAALAWLEGLAAKQGVPEEELITKPEQRAEIPSIAEVQEAAGIEAPASLAEEVPDWLKAVEAEVPEEIGSAAEIVPAVLAEDVPDWLKVAEAEVPEEIAPAAEVVPAAPAEEIPDWLKAAEAEVPEEIAPAAEVAPAAPAEEVPDWLKAADAEVPEGITQAAEVVPAIPAEEIPDWLKATEAEISEEVAPAIEVTPAEAAPAAEGELPAGLDLTDQDAALAWLEGLAAKQGVPEEELITRPEERAEILPITEAQEAAGVEAPAAPVEELPEWMKAAEAEVPEEITPAAEVAPTAPAEEVPDWLKTVEAEVPEEIAPVAEVAPAAPAEDVPDWLSTLEAEIPEEIAPAAEVVPAIPAEEIPDWLKAAEAEISEEVAPAIEVTPAEAVPAAEGELPAGLDLTDQDAALAWLEGLAAKQGVPEEELITRPEERAEIPPITEAQEAAGVEATAAPVEELPEWMKEIETEAVTPAVEILPIIPAEEVPDWLKAAEAEVPEEITPAAEVAPAAPAEEVPDWLSTLEAKIPEEIAPAAEVVPAIPAEEVPDWLKAAEVEIPEEVAPAVEVTPAEAAPAAEGELPAGLDLTDQDAALAWLEGLAAKQGVPEEELITKPEERAEIPPIAEAQEAAGVEATAAPVEELPEWMKEIETEAVTPAVEVLPTVPAEEVPDWLSTLEAETLEEIAPAAEVAPAAPAEEVPDWLSTLEAETPEEVAPAVEVTPAEAVPAAEGELPAGIDLTNQDAALAWLEGLAAKQGVPEEELITKPEQRAEAPSDWVHETAAVIHEAATVEVPEEEVADISVGKTPVTIVVPEVETSPVEAAPVEIPSQPTEWIKETELPEWLEKTELAKPVEKAEPEAELPGWIAEATSQETEVAWEPPKTIEVEAKDITPDHARTNLNSASVGELERLPGIGFVLAQSIINYRATRGPFIRLEDLSDVPGIGPGTIEVLKNWITIQPVKAETMMEEGGPPLDPDHIILRHAHNALHQGDIPAATKQYEQLLNRMVLLNEIILDLQDALYRYPVEISIWQTLGDAYMRNNQLQDALDAYTKAEELLR